MVQQEVIMENLTSPAARMPYAGIKDNTQEIGLVIVIKMTILKHRSALSASMPPDVINDLVFSAGTETLSNHSHQSNADTDCGDTV